MLDDRPHAPASPPPAWQPSFGELLRHRRERAGLTQQSLAGLSTIGARTIRDLESGRAQARSRTVQLLADGLRLQGQTREQFVAAGTNCRADAPAPRPPYAVPELVNTLVGRDLEMQAMVEALTSGRRRAISLCGLPGVGKTRLAAEIAARLSSQHGWTVSWMALDEAGPRPLDRPAASRRRPPARLAVAPARLFDDLPGGGGRDVLLVLDDVRPGPGLAGLGSVLASMSGVRVVSTSRALWHLPGVQPTVLPPLAIPGPEWADPGWDDWEPALDRLAQLPSIHLLVERLREVKACFALAHDNAAALVTVCRRSDGLPLVLELMARLFRVLSLDELAGIPDGELLSLTLGVGAGSVADLLRASLARLDARQHDILDELANSDRERTIVDLAATLRRSLVDLTDDLGVLIGHGLIGTSPGVGSSYVVLPTLVRACLDRRPVE